MAGQPSAAWLLGGGMEASVRWRLAVTDLDRQRQKRVGYTVRGGRYAVTALPRVDDKCGKAKNLATTDTSIEISFVDALQAAGGRFKVLHKS